MPGLKLAHTLPAPRRGFPVPAAPALRSTEPVPLARTWVPQPHAMPVRVVVVPDRAERAEEPVVLAYATEDDDPERVEQSVAVLLGRFNAARVRGSVVRRLRQHLM